MNRDVEQLVRRARRNGLTVELTAGKHYRLRRGEQFMFMSATPSSSRTVRNTIARIRRTFGVDLRPDTSRPRKCHASTPCEGAQ